MQVRTIKSMGSRGRSLRAARRRRRFFMIALAVGLGAPFFASALWEHLGSEVYRVKAVMVRGAHAVSPEAIVAASGLSHSSCLFFVDESEMRERVEALPYIKSCSVAREFPDKVFISVTERTPVATLLVDNRFFSMDGSCVVLRELSREEEHPGPFITCGAESGSAVPGEQVTYEPVREALAVWMAFSGTEMAADVHISEIAAAAINDLRMYCDELPFELRWGRGEYALQAQRLDTLWKQTNKQLPCRQYLDLRFGRDLACK